ncbi:FG-GAP repeat protein [Bradyrhizobium lablabi]|uniref:Ig-like domain-containing protein n=1 Tax=Bradyrhizobium lablabi TaxID=722472 RepID=UPI001BAB65AD|nr:Ig-like domain-containing protein [Bradyrhizobium lablabi]MBR1124195.1 FG-GAP repeat protein [Bradyrhizobium lablabi]
MADSSIQLDSGGSILFVGNSFTFGRVDPVMSYNTDNVRDLTAPVPGTTFENTTGSNPYEPHPWGGVPGIFEAFAHQAGLELDVAISARNAATLQGQYLNSNPAGWDLRGNVASQSWDVVVLQDNSTQALPSGSGSITFAAGSSTATLTVHPTADATVETDETVGIQVTANSAYRTSAGVITGTILNDDPSGPVVDPNLPTVTLVASPGAVLEDGTQKLVYTFTRTGATTSALTVNFTAFRDGSTAPSVAIGTGDFENNVSQFTSSFQADTGQAATGSMSFTSNTGTVTIPAGATSVTFTLDPRPDATVENDESIRLTLSSNAAYNVGTQGAVYVTILNDDFAAGTDTSLPNISVSLAASAVYEDGSGNLVYEFTRTGSNADPLTVNFNVSGTATLPGGDFTVTGADSFSTSGAADPNLQSFKTYAVKLAEYATTGAADGGIPVNPNANAATDVYLYETWARPNMVAGAHVASTDDATGAVTTTATTAPEYYASLEDMTADLRAAYEGLAAANPIFAGVAPVGAAFLAAVQNGTATRDPYAPDAGADGKVDLWWDDNLHASKYGSYLSALTLFGTLTGLDPRALGAAEHAATDLGITPAEAAALQAVAAATLGFSLDAHWTAPGQVTELQGGTGLLATAGSFGFSDSDAADAHTVTVTPLTPGAIGTFTATVHSDTTGDGTGGAINWLYTVDNADIAFLAPGATRVEHFRVTIADANGGLVERDIAVTINGISNETPVAQAGTGTGSEDTDIIGQLVATDADAGSNLTYALVADAAHGTVVVNPDGSYTYTPDANYNGGDSFTFKANDGTDDSNTATVTLTVNAVNDAPVNTVPAGPLTTPGNANFVISGLSVSDVDATSLTTILHVDHGTLTVAAGYAAVSGSGTGTVTLTGTMAEINATLANATHVTYHGAVGYAGPDTLTVTTDDGGTGTGGPLSDVDTVSITVRPRASHDFNGDGMSDIVWRHDSGLAQIWDMDGPTILQANTLGGLNPTWNFAGTGDFRSDGKADLIWRNDPSGTQIWNMDNGTITNASALGAIPTAWHILDTGDFNGDGTTDLLWRHDNGTVQTWSMSNSHFVGADTLGVIPAAWQLAGTGDFNGDGKTDLLWRHDSGFAQIWDMDGGNILNSHDLGSIPTTWQVAGIGDFNGDNTSDILWRHDSGVAQIWDINNGNVQSTPWLGLIPNDWKIAGIGDYNGDHTSDIVLRHDSGLAQMWEMNNDAIAQATSLGVIPNNWHIIA